MRLTFWRAGRDRKEDLRAYGRKAGAYLATSAWKGNQETVTHTQISQHKVTTRQLGHYKLPACQDPEVLRQHIGDVFIKNNNHIMDGITKGSTRMGLVVNRDETLQSTEILCYGKRMFFRGNLLPPDCKAMARTTSISNDQIPSFANVPSTVSTNCLTMAQYNDGVRVPMDMFSYFSCLSIAIPQKFNYILKRPATELIMSRQDVLWRLLFVDPSTGGITGTSLTCFLIRQFPDPVTEALSFWKRIYTETTDPQLKSFSYIVENPTVERLDFTAFEKLLEDPSSLNLPKGLSAATALKEAVRKFLIDNIDQIKSTMFRDLSQQAKKKISLFSRFLYQ